MTRFAAVDIGTNSVRLLVADVEGAGPDASLTTVERRMRITRLGQGVDAARALAPEAIERTLAVLREYRGVIEAYDVQAVRATATSAARDSANRDDFFGPATESLGVTPELLSGEEEARLSFLGATAGLDVPAPYLVVDIGGGSTEFVVGTTEPEGLRSLDVGCVRITEQFLHSDPPAPEELSAAVSVVRDEVAEVRRVIPETKSAKTLIGLAGTVTTVAAIELGIPEYDADAIHHFRLTRAVAEDVFRTLALESAAQRRHNPGLEAERVDVIVGGALVLVSILRVFGFDEVLVSEADILDGLVRSLARDARRGREIHHFGGRSPQNPRMETTVPQFLDSLRAMNADDVRRIAASLDSETLTDEVDWWRATIAIDKVLRHSRCSRQAGRAANDAVLAVQESAARDGITLPDVDVTRVARAAADVARGLAAGPPARPIVRLLLEHWEPVRTG